MGRLVISDQPTTPRLSDEDVVFFSEGAHRRLAHKMGAHVEPALGASFSLWAPHARSVTVMGNFNDWNPINLALTQRGSTGIWQTVVSQAKAGDVYKFVITDSNGTSIERNDPFAQSTQAPPRTGSVIWDPQYEWRDHDWMERRGQFVTLDAALSIYEVHLGSWGRSSEDPEVFLSYREVASRLVEHASRCGFTHVEFLPLMEHFRYGSWGYQTSSFFAPSRRFGRPEDLMALIDELHQANIGVILDWVPSHFSGDHFGLAEFDGTRLYEHEGSSGSSPSFNYDRPEVRSFLSSSAEHWLSTYHADGIRVGAVTSMLYRDPADEHEGAPGTDPSDRETLGAIEFLQQLNAGINEDHPEVRIIAEESTAYPGVSRPAFLGGVGFALTWDTAWTRDTLAYLARDSVYRRHHHGELTSRSVYANSENFVLPLSHDEVVDGKGSLLTKMPGDESQRFANLRLLFGYQFALPGKKLIFMGGEFGQVREWDHRSPLDWALLDKPVHAGVQQWVSDLNRLYREVPALWELDGDLRGYNWTQPNDAHASLLSFLRFAHDGSMLLAIFNFTPVPRYDCLAGVPVEGHWRELVNSDDLEYGGSGVGNPDGVEARDVATRGMPHTLALNVPPLGCVFLAPSSPGRDRLVS
jgi:1,4-alpha-glucan branching enzyme